MTKCEADGGDLEFSSDDLDRILQNTFIREIDYAKQQPSTNTRAAQLAENMPQGASPVLVLTDCQTAGRGRGTNRWWSATGSLTFSVLFRTSALEVPVSRWPQVSLTTGLAVCDAIESLLGHVDPRIKWPNDVMLNDRKVCGILVEASDGRQGNLIIGVGVNVSNKFDGAPPELQASVIALGALSSDRIQRADVLVTILQRLELRMNWLSSDPESLQRDWSRRCFLTGRNIEIGIHSQQTSGTCEGIDRDGALIVCTSSGRRRFLSGTILNYR